MTARNDDKRLLALLLKSLGPCPIPANVKKCDSYSEDDYRDYALLRMDRDRRIAFESHCEVCLSCQGSLIRIFKEEGLEYRGEDPAFLERCMETARAAIDERLNPPGLQAAYLLAASSDPDVDRREALVGIAYGVGVDKEARKGFLIECVARVGPRRVEKGSLGFNVDQVRGLRRGEEGYEISPPFKFVEHKLRELFKHNEYLAPFGLERRHTVVEIEPTREDGFFREAKSLSLAVVVAILSAVSGKDTSGTAFSGRIRQDGSLFPPVGDIGLKIEAARAGKMTCLVLPEANRKDLPDGFIEEGALSVRFFSHIGQVLQHLGLTPETAPEQSAPAGAPAEEPQVSPAPPAPPPSGGKARIAELAGEAGISPGVIGDFIELAEDLSQVRIEQRPLGTALILGDPEEAARHLLPSEIRVEARKGPREMLEYLKALATVVNGEMSGFLFDKSGLFHSIRKTAVSGEDDSPGTRLLSGLDKQYGVISALTRSLVFVLPPGGNRVQVFCNGPMIARYLNGTWEAADPGRFGKHLETVARKKGYNPAALERMGRIALAMADRNLGALMVFFDRPETIHGRYEDCLGQLGVTMERTSLNELTDRELISFAREDGALFVEGLGVLHTFKAILRPRMVPGLEYDQGVGARHFSAQCFSADARCLAMVVSEDGAVSLYCDGERICRI